MQLGHLHPLFVHLPIGILILVFFLEIYNRRKPSESGNNIITFSLGIGTLTALTSLGTGLLLGENGAYDEQLLFLHRWMAIALTACTVLLFIFKRNQSRWSKKIYFPLFIVVMALLGITGHYGGAMTHGEDYLFQKATQKKTVSIENVDDAQIYTQIIQPILDAKCVSCHSTSKLKGGLLLHSKEGLIAGGDTGNIMNSIDGKEALMLKLLHLPTAHEDHMPPKGKVQLSEDEFALIEWWMANDYCFDCTPGSLKKSKKLGKILTNLETDNSTRGQLARTLENVPNSWLLSLKVKGISAFRLEENSSLIAVNLAEKNNLEKSHFSALDDYAEHIVELNLDNSNFNDDLSSQLLSFKNITKLQLKNTQITDKTVKKLNKLEKLESLSLFGNTISDASLKSLASLSNLKNLYTEQTQITSKGLALLSKNSPTITVNHISDTVFADSQLGEPEIKSVTDLFEESLSIELANIFDVNLYYTLDGTNPDSTSLKYEKPIRIDKSVVLKSFSHKEGWLQSKIKTRAFRKTGVKFDSVWFETPPNESYSGQGSKSLTDLKRGKRDLTGKRWIGYSGKHFTSFFKLAEEQEVSQISVSTISFPMDWVFFPIGCTVWTSMDGKNYKKIHTENFGTLEPNMDNIAMFKDISFKPTKAKFVKLKLNSILKNPDWHPYPNRNSWILTDEIIIK